MDNFTVKLMIVKKLHSQIYCITKRAIYFLRAKYLIGWHLSFSWFLMSKWFMSLSKVSYSNLDCDDAWDKLLESKLYAAILFKCNIIRKKVKIIFSERRSFIKIFTRSHSSEDLRWISSENFLKIFKRKDFIKILIKTFSF